MPPNQIISLRNSLTAVEIIVIEEYGMISQSILVKINVNLQEALQNTLIFGGLTILLVGDIRHFHQLRIRHYIILSVPRNLLKINNAVTRL